MSSCLGAMVPALISQALHTGPVYRDRRRLVEENGLAETRARVKAKARRGAPNVTETELRRRSDASSSPSDTPRIAEN